MRRAVLLCLLNVACSLRAVDYLGNGDAGAGGGDAGPQCPAPPAGALSKATALSAFGLHACAQLEDRTVACWGENMHAQSGASASSPFVSRPMSVPVPGGAVSIAAGRVHACAVAVSGEVWCWGYGAWGEVGGAQSDGNPHVLPVRSALPDAGPWLAQRVFAGKGLTCALGDAGVLCAGEGDYGQLGVPPTVTVAVPVRVTAVVEAVELVAGTGWLCARSSSELACWGTNDRRELGASTSTVCGATPCSWTPVEPQLVPPFAQPARALAGAFSPCAVDAAGVLQCWGDDTDGRTGDTSFAVIGVGPDEPHRVTGMPALVAAAGGEASLCGVSEAGEVWCVGSSARGLLGPGTPVDGGVVRAPRKVEGLTQVTAVVVGDDFACALDRCGAVWCWGANQRGQLGAGDAQAAAGLVRVVEEQR